MSKRFSMIIPVLLVSFLFSISACTRSMRNEEFIQLCGNGTLEEVKKAISNGADVNPKDQLGTTALMYAAGANSNPLVITELIKAGADINAKDLIGTRKLVLFYTITNSNPAVNTSLNKFQAELMQSITNGADMNPKDQRGITALMYAAIANSNPLVIAELIKAGANINAKDQHGITTLMYAAGDNSNPLVIAALIKAGADINAKDQHGGTALMYAAFDNSNPEIITELIKGGADLNAKDKDGNTALDIAKNGKRQNAPQMIEILTKAGAK